MKKLERGEYGYLKQRKSRLILHLIILIVIAVAIFLTGFFVNKKETANIFTVAAILMVLPAAKTFVILFVTLPYSPMTAEEKKMIDGQVSPCDKVFYDVVFTSSERPMHLDAIVVTGHQVIGYTSRKKDDISKTDRYFKNEFEKRQLDFVSFITDSEKAFVNRFKMRSDSEEVSEKQKKNMDEVISFIRTSIV